MIELGSVWPLVLGLLLGIGLGWWGHRQGLLARGGAWSVAIISALIFGLGGWIWGALLLLYWIGAGLWSRYRHLVKASLPLRAGQACPLGWETVWSTTAWALVLTLLQRLAPQATGIFVAFAGTIATVNADAWATELGLLSVRPPRLITTRRRVAAGTPGGVTVLGCVAALAGAWLIGFTGLLGVVLAAWVQRLTWERALVWLPLSATAGGMAGCLVDSLLGAMAQGMYYCERCDKPTEERVHGCGQAARQVRGWSWLTQRGVDFVSSVVGAAVAAGLMAWLAQTGL